MSNKVTSLKWSDLKGRPVVDIATAKKVGSVDDLIMDPATREVVGLKFKPGLFSADQTVPISLLNSLGDDAITVRLEGINQDSPEEQNLKKFPTLTDVMSEGVVTESGKLVGSISNVTLLPQPLTLLGYEVSEGGVFAKKHYFDVSPQVRYGDKLVIIPDGVLDVAKP